MDKDKNGNLPKTFADKLKEHNAYSKKVTDEIRDLITAIKNTYDIEVASSLCSKANGLKASLKHRMSNFDTKHKVELKILKDYLESESKRE